MKDRAMGLTPAHREHCQAALWFARAAVTLVCTWNLTAALPFVFNPASYLHSFELAGGGIGAEALVRGLGIAF